ncbi:MAG: helix-turn-helix domain-containing protein [Methylotenera sp.]|nr:helix-turn-helix domain-containing protein [Methylotenera sp.]MDP2230874.1 helix-turn-helix domain-containing protein [Methylotenera sp.]MDP3140290.1 helix-turn-helix domain-containing protein [Methylotenera sp.]
MPIRATSLFELRGIHASSVNNTAAASGITKTTLYKYFSSKNLGYPYLQIANPCSRLQGFALSQANASPSLTRPPFGIQLPVFQRSFSLSLNPSFRSSTEMDY